MILDHQENKKSEQFAKILAIKEATNDPLVYNVGTIGSGSKTIEWYGNKNSSPMDERHTYECDLKKGLDGKIRLRVFHQLPK